MIRAIAAALACAAFAGCAATQRPGQFWYVDTDPQGAVVTTDIGLLCVTPCRLEVPRWNREVRAFSYVIEKEGYAPVRGEAGIRANETLALGTLLAVGMTAAGAPTAPGPLNNKGVMQIDPNPLHITLTPTQDQ